MKFGMLIELNVLYYLQLTAYEMDTHVSQNALRSLDPIHALMYKKISCTHRLIKNGHGLWLMLLDTIGHRF